ncbi:MAG: hypothetical protein Q9217_003786 [Psora testacea]
MFSCPPPPETSRPRLKSSRSTGWSWPRLVNVQEKQQVSATKMRADSVPHEEQAPYVTNDESAPLPPTQNSNAVEATEKGSQIAPPIKSSGGLRAAESPIPPLTEEEQLHDSSMDSLQETLQAEDSSIAETDVRPSGNEERAGLASIQRGPEREVTEVAKDPTKSEPPPIIPIIKIQRASKSSDHSEVPYQEVTARPTIDSVLRGDRQRISKHPANQGSNFMAVLPQPTDTLPEIAPIPIRVTKRKIALRKTRNAIARKTLLKMGLGRQLAIPTKEALRRQAKGEDVTVADILMVS